MILKTNKINIIVPCYNPLKGWEKTLKTNFFELKDRMGEEDMGLILVNDGSTKNVSQLDIKYLKEEIPGFRYYYSEENKGKGSALRMGVAASLSKYAVFTDIDFPYELDSMVQVYKKLVEGSDVALGTRDYRYYEKTPFIRKLISKLFRKSMKLLLNLKVSDTQCGLKGFNEKGKEEFLKTTINRFLFDLEFVKRCSRKNSLLIETVNVQLKENVIFSHMNFKILLIEGFNFIFILLRK